MKRRTLIQALSILPVTGMSLQGFAADTSKADINAMRERWRKFLPAGFQAPSAASKLSHSEQEWRKLLGTDAFEVLRKEATERAGSSPLNDEKRDGVFACAGCDLPLFTSQMKYESGTGWPSFFTHIPDALETKRDFKMIWPRTEYHCARCGGHQGHVFSDGPAPTNERWCNNGVALKFLPS